jgi:hypothetical protein
MSACICIVLHARLLKLIDCMATCCGKGVIHRDNNRKPKFILKYSGMHQNAFREAESRERRGSWFDGLDQRTKQHAVIN